jgi:hypothetical protein
MTHPSELIKRLGIAGILVALVFLVRLLYQASGPASSHYLYFTGAYLILIAFAGYQLLRSVALIAVSRRSTSPILQAIHLRGIRGTLWEVYRRRLAPGLRLPLLLFSWALLIGCSVWILWRTHSLDTLQARTIGSLSRANDSTGYPVCRVISLETADNNLGRYYQALLRIARDLRTAGAKIVLAEQSRYEGPYSVWRALLDSIKLSGVILYQSGEGISQSLPLPNPGPGDWRHAQILDQSRLLPEKAPTMIAFRPVPSWYTGPQLHAALHAVAQFRGEPTIQQPFYLDGAIRYADLRLPVTEEGESFVPFDGRMRKALAATALLRPGNDTLFYMDDSRPELTATMSPSLISQVRGQIVLIRWFDTGGLGFLWKETKTSSLPSIIDALHRNRLITPTGSWHQVLTIVVLLLGVGLSLGRHLGVASVVMVLVAAAILGTEAWIFSSQSILADLIYPSLAAVLAGIFLPLVAHFHHHP